MLARRRRQPRGRFSWRTLAFEVFVVVLGVTLALGANEIRQHFVDQREEQVALRGIAGEMQYNCDRLTQTHDYHTRVLAELDSVRAVGGSTLQGDGMATMQQLPSWRGYNPAFVTTAAYETAQAKGALALFPYEQALGIGRYYTLVGMYQGLVRQSLGVVMQTGQPTLAQVEVVLRISSELQRELAPQSCEGAKTLDGESSAVARDSTATAS